MNVLQERGICIDLLFYHAGRVVSVLHDLAKNICLIRFGNNLILRLSLSLWDTYISDRRFWRKRVEGVHFLRRANVLYTSLLASVIHHTF